MIKIKQTTFGDRKGNCLSACIASILDIDDIRKTDFVNDIDFTTLSENESTLIFNILLNKKLEDLGYYELKYNFQAFNTILKQLNPFKIEINPIKTFNQNFENIILNISLPFLYPFPYCILNGNAIRNVDSFDCPGHGHSVVGIIENFSIKMIHDPNPENTFFRNNFPDTISFLIKK